MISLFMCFFKTYLLFHSIQIVVYVNNHYRYLNFHIFDIYIYKHILNTIKNLKIRMYIILIVKSFITVAILAQERLAVSDLCGDITQT